MEVEDILEHHGVKGQKWGVRRQMTNTGLRVEGHFELSGKATPKPGDTFTHKGASQTVLSVGQKPDGTHVVRAKATSKVTPEQKAILKVQGKNYVQRAMGDKEFWKKAAAVGGVTLAGLGIASAGPGVLPLSALAAVGGAGHFTAVVSGSTLAAARGGNIVNAINYRRRVANVRRTILHSGLAHAADSTVEEVYNGLTDTQREAAETLIAAAVNGVDVSEESDLNDAWASMTDDQHAAVYFLATVADVDRETSSSVAHSNDPVDDILAHHGIKGQKWGVRKDLVGLSDLSPGGGMAIGKTRGSAELTKKEIKTVSSATEAVRKTLMDKTGMMSPNGPIAALNKAHRAQYKDAQPTPAQIKDYDKKFTAIAESHANAVAPRGTVARVHLDGPDMFLFVGEKSAVERAMSEFRHDDLTTKLVVIRDETGAIVEIRPSSLEHSDDPVDDILAHHGIKGQKWGVRRQTGASGLVSRIVGKKATDTANPGNKPDGLIPRTGSADQIHQDRIQKKIDTNGINSLSNAEIQSYTRRLQMEKDIKTALAAQSAATQAKADGFIKSFIKKQGGRQADRFVNKALDVAFEAAVKQAGVKLEPNNPALGKGLQEVGKRLAPKKK